SNSLKNAINTPELDKQIHIEYLVITTRVLIVFDYPSTTYTNTLSLHDALPIWRRLRCEDAQRRGGAGRLARSSSRPARALDGDAQREHDRAPARPRCPPGLHLGRDGRRRGARLPAGRPAGLRGVRVGRSRPAGTDR